MKIFFLKLIATLLLLKSTKTELYTDYELSEDDQNYPNYVTNDDYQIHRTPSTDSGNNALSEHAMVTNSNVFPYMVTIMKGSTYVSSGALIGVNWVLTAADGLFLLRESLRLLRVRLGSINYKKGGVIMPVKLLEIHPYFDDKKPNFDLALVMLAKPVRYRSNLHAIRLQKVPRDVTATHFIVTSWPGPLSKSENSSHLQSMEMIKRDRILTVTHLHPTDADECTEELKEIGAESDSILCLEPSLKDPCLRDIGAPVVLNQILWAVISSWKPDDCDRSSDGPVFATLVSTKNVSIWIHSTVHGHMKKTTTTHKKNAIKVN